MTTVEIARNYLDAGLNCIPILPNGTKSPAVAWTRYKEETFPRTELQKFKGNGIAVLGGAISGNLEVMDFDSKETWKEYVRKASPDILATMKKCVVVRTPAKGFHLYYRTLETPEGNRKLAWDENHTILIETRGTGGYVLAPGSPAECHPIRKTYTVVHGDILSVQCLHPHEHENLINYAKTFNRHFETLKMSTPPKTPVINGKRPGDVYNAKGNYYSVLRAAGWKEEGRRGDEVYWTRPLKRTGISATSNYGGFNIFYVFSSNAHPFNSDEGYTPFEVYAILECGGDFRRAAKQLYEKGFK